MRTGVFLPFSALAFVFIPREVQRSFPLLVHRRVSHALQEMKANALKRSMINDNRVLASFTADLFPTVHELAHLSGWDPYLLRDLSAHVSWVPTVATGRSCAVSNDGG